MSGHGEKMVRKQELAIMNLLLCPTIVEAAQKTGIGEATLLRWLQQPEFAEQYRDAKRLAVNQAISRLQQCCSTAVETLVLVMQDPTSRDTARISASKIVLELSVKAIEIEELQARLEVLEELVADRTETTR